MNSVSVHSLSRSDTVHDLRAQRESRTNGFISNNSEFVVYRVLCRRGRFYVSRMKRKLKEHFAEHRTEMKSMLIMRTTT